MPETIVTACHDLPGVRVEWISRYPEGGGLQSDLEALERMTADPEHAAETLVSLCPVVFRSQWAMLVEVTGDQAASLLDHAGSGSRRRHRDRFAPFDGTHRVDLDVRLAPRLGRLDRGGHARSPGTG